MDDEERLSLRHRPHYAKKNLKRDCNIVHTDPKLPLIVALLNSSGRSVDRKHFMYCYTVNRSVRKTIRD